MELSSNFLPKAIVAHPITSASIFFALYIVTVFILRERRLLNQSNFPPGPKPLPFIGNLHQLPRQKPFLAFTQWAKTYSSPIIGFRLGRKPVVVLNTWRAVHDLFDQRGSIYSSRPQIPIIEYVVPGPIHVAFMPHDKNWRRGRAALVAFLKEEELVKVAPVQEAESTQMVWEIMQSPALHAAHVKRAFCAVILESVYGVRGTRDLTDRFFAVQDEWAEVLDLGAMPPLDVFPWLKYVPSVLTPWPGWRKRGVELGKVQRGYYEQLMDKGMGKMKSGLTDTFLAKLLDRQEKEGFTDLELLYLGGFLLEAGADTTAVALQIFILAMAAHQDVQKCAQDEIDAAFGEEMPGNIDGAKLPYLGAILWEVLRWRPSFPTSLPHATSKDDTYEGYYIPAETMVLMNTWAIQHNEDDYPNADTFDPTRFLANEYGTTSSVSSADDESRRRTYAFGAGRRICAGQEMAQKSLLLSMAKLVWAFDMRPKHGETLNTDLMTGFKDAILTGPKEVEIDITLRDEGKREVIRKQWAKADGVLKRYE